MDRDGCADDPPGDAVETYTVVHAPRGMQVSAPSARSAVECVQSQRWGACGSDAFRANLKCHKDSARSACSAVAEVPPDDRSCASEACSGAGAEGLPVFEQLLDRVTAEFFEERFGEHERDH